MATPTITHYSFAWEYDVFLSFRGEDTRKTFTDHLYSALHQAGIRTFRDEENLRKGEYLAPELKKAIQSSRIAMIVFSKDYASSRWCLDELVQIVECKEKEKQIVLPIFYNVEPSEVRKQSGNYALAFVKHEEHFVKHEVQKWRDVLTKVADMSGWDLQHIANGYESKFIDLIIKEVQLVLRHVPMFVVKHGVGLEYRVEQVVGLLLRESNDSVRMIEIYGREGIGKTTLARAIYNRLIGYFESSCFLEIESAISRRQENEIDLEKVNKQTKNLQKELFRKLFNEVIKVGSTGDRIMLMQQRLQAKKCFIVIDNLEHINQFNALCGERDWFGRGSIIILTTTETHLLKKLKEDEYYEAEELNSEESLQLFSLHAFGEPVLPREGYTKLSNDIVARCGGLPLALKVLGSFLSDKSREEWISAFAKLKEIPNNDVLAKLKISYDGLPDDRTKSAFLDLVCFSRSCDKETIDNMGNISNSEIRDLADRCLIEKGWDSWVSMHDLIREMGREIIRLESPNNPGERSRLWCPKDIHDVLIGQKGTKKIEVIVFDDSPIKNTKYSTKAFKNMENLRFLQINGSYVDGKFKHLPKKLRYLQWRECPLKHINIPSNSSFEKLVNLSMKWSKIKEFRTPLKYFPCLELLELDDSRYLIRTPDFSGAQNFRKLSFQRCSNLVKVHSSIGELGKLVHLNFHKCENLKELPNNLSHLNSLQFLDVSFAPKLKAKPEIFANLTSIQQMYLGGTNTYGVLSNLSLLSKLEKIHLNFCKKIEVLPKLHHIVENVHLDHCHNLKMIQQLPSNLREFTLDGCENLQMLSELPPNLKKFSLKGCDNLKMIPQFPPHLEEFSFKCSKNLKMTQLPNFPPNLRKIRLNGCKNLKMIPELPQKLYILRVTNCDSMEKVPNLSNCTSLEELDFTGCQKLKEIRGWKNLHLTSMKLGGVPHIDF